MPPSERERLLVITGPTATGKTRLAVTLAERLSGEIISADSRQVYRGMDIGTGKDLSDYILPDGTKIPYHLIDIVDAGEVYDLYQWLSAFRAAYVEVLERGAQPLLVGGTGLYIETALRGQEMVSAPADEDLRTELETLSLADLQKILRRYPAPYFTSPTTKRRTIRAIEIARHLSRHPQSAIDSEPTPIPYTLICLTAPSEERIQKIEARLDARLAGGMLEEVQGLLERGISPDCLIAYGLEYRFLTLHLQGVLSYTEMRTQLAIAIRQFSKRQMTWFRGMERRGYTVHFIPTSLPPEQQIERILHLHSTSS